MPIHTCNAYANHDGHQRRALRKAKRRAADEQIPLRDVVEAALRRYLSRKIAGGKYRLRWDQLGPAGRPGFGSPVERGRVIGNLISSTSFGVVW